MTRIKTTIPEEARGLRKILVKMTQRQTGGMVPGIQRILMPDFQVAIPPTGSTRTSTCAGARL